MNQATGHATQAERLIDESNRPYNHGDTGVMHAEAQAHAILALTAELRMSNIIAARNAGLLFGVIDADHVDKVIATYLDNVIQPTNRRGAAQ